MRSKTMRRALRSATPLIVVATLIHCGKGADAPVVPTLVTNAGNGQSAAYSTAVTTPPSVKVVDASGAALTGITVTFAVAGGGGSVTGPTQTTTSTGIATVGSWTLGSTLGANTLTASATGAAASITFTATAIAGPAKTMAVNAGNAQSVVAGSAVAIAPSVKVTDAAGNPVTGTSVTFAIATGGGTIAGGSQTTNSSGIATITTWTPATIGSNTLMATAAGLTGSPITFTATGTIGPAAKLVFTTAPASTVANRAAMTPAPVVQIQDANGNNVAQSGTVITAAITAGGGAISGATATTGATGAATFSALVISGITASHTVVFSATGLTTIGQPITTTAGVATTIAVFSGNNATGVAGGQLPNSPLVIVTDADNNPVQGVTVTFAVTSGGGFATGLVQTTINAGTTGPGIWTLGATPGVNTMTATVPGLAGSPLTLTATGSLLSLTTISPSLLTPGTTMTITGAGFSTTAASNTVTIDGTAATVTAATATQITATVPSFVSCRATHDATVSVAVNGGTVSGTKALQIATQRTLAIGELLVVTDPTLIRCNELTTTGGRYYVDVYNTNTTYSTTGASFMLRGEAGSGAAGASPPGIVASPTVAPTRPISVMSDAARKRVAMTPSAPDPGQAMHYKMLEFNRALYAQQRGSLQTRSKRANLTVAPPNVGDPMTVKIPNFNTSSPCTINHQITGRVAYVGTKSIVVEDVTNPIRNIDTTYAQIGSEFDNVMFPILLANFGNPLAMDAQLDNNGREIMVFSHYINDSLPALNGFVSSCDFFPSSASATSGSNVGEYFYARVPTTTGTISTNTSPPGWRWLLRGTIIHESKHIVSFATHITDNAASFEESWLEESTARISEELYERSLYTLAQKSNIGYGSAASPVGPYCGVRACNGNPQGFVRVFQELSLSSSGTGNGWFIAMEDHSPLGRQDANDFSFYSTGWSLDRWAIDNSSLTESAFLTALIGETSKTGVANLEARAGRLFPDMLPLWSMANVVDDYPGFTPLNTLVKQASWNFRSVMAGLNTDFPSSHPLAWPLVTFARSFGTWADVDYHVLPGTTSFVELSGTQTTKQMIELKAGGTSTANAPTGVRIAILRVQ